MCVCVCKYLSYTRIALVSNTVVYTIVFLRRGENPWVLHHTDGIRGVSWIHCDAFHVELFVLARLACNLAYPGTRQPEIRTPRPHSASRKILSRPMNADLGVSLLVAFW